MRECAVEGVFEDVVAFAERAEVAFAGLPDGVPFGVVDVADQRGPVACFEPAGAVAQLDVTSEDRVRPVGVGVGSQEAAVHGVRDEPSPQPVLGEHLGHFGGDGAVADQFTGCVADSDDH